MQTLYTLILQFNKNEFPFEFSKNDLLLLIQSTAFDIDYFGVEIDNQADYINEQMKEWVSNNSFITLHFEAVEKIVFNTIKSEVEKKEIILKIINESSFQEVRNYGKDLEIYLN